MPYTQFVEVGRLALISYGELANKLCVIVDVIDDKHVVIDLVEGEAHRQTIAIRRLKLTDLVAKIERSAATEAIKSALSQQQIVAKWNGSKWSQRLVREAAKLQMNDFQRFKHDRLVAQREQLIKQELAKH